MHCLETLERLNATAARAERDAKTGRAMALGLSHIESLKRSSNPRRWVMIWRLQTRLLALAAALLALEGCHKHEGPSEPQPGPIDPAPPYPKKNPRILTVLPDGTPIVLVPWDVGGV